MKNIIKSYFSNKRGMTLVEVLTAMVLLSLIIFCFTPLFLTYFKAITIAGTEIQDVQEQSGILQTVIGNYSAGKGGNYSANVTEIGLELTTPQTATLTRENASGSTVSANLNGAVTVALGSDIDDVKGDFLVSDPENLRNGYTTIKAQGSSSGLVCYPKSLTDDFIEAKIIVYGSGGINFADSSFATDIKLSCGLNGGTSLSNGTDYTVRKLASSMLEFTIYGGGKISFETSPLLINYKDGQHILQVEVDAPSMIMVGEADDEGKYYYYVSRGEVIDGTDADSNKDELAIIRRVMHTTSDPNDPTVGVSNPTTLTSAMNDVEWVPASSADNYSKYDKDGNGAVEDDEKYGYYIMCGDNGQVRRFWRNPTTGNYYWGGDYTYYTDYNLNRFSGNSMYMNTTDENGNASTSKVYSTDASFKYIALRPMQWESGSAPNDNFLGIGGSKYAKDSQNKYRTGFNMSTRTHGAGATAHLRNLCTVSANYSDKVQFYGSDGKLLIYLSEQKDTGVKNPEDCNGNNIWAGALNNTEAPNYDDVLNWKTNGGTYHDVNGYTNTIHPLSSQSLQYASEEAWGWLDPKDGDSYYEFYGINNDTSINEDSYPITLTSVDAILIKNDGTGVYETDVRDTSKSHYFKTGIISNTDTSGDATNGTDTGSATLSTNLTYPTSNYNLYCGYIPAYMDAWAGMTGGSAKYRYDIEFLPQYAKRDDAYGEGLPFQVLNTNVGRASNRQTVHNNTNYNKLWRMTMGITPYYTSGTALEWDKNGGQIAYSTRYSLNDKGKVIDGWNYGNTLVYYPYKNLQFAITGKFYDGYTYNNNKSEITDMFGSSKALGDPTTLISQANTRQNNVTAGKVIDITISYLSHPLAISIAANPTDDIVYDYSNDKSSAMVFFWHNRRESITFLDSASTVIPNGDKDVPVSLMVGYVLGGTVAYYEGTEAGDGDGSGDGATVDITSVMNNGIVFLRAGQFNTAMHGAEGDSILDSLGGLATNSKTGEFKATDKTGYKLDQESNVFHQFYYLNSRTEIGKSYGHHGEYSENPKKDKHIGNLYGAKYWQNNRHIQYRSITGGMATDGTNTNSTYEYLRSHPMADTKVNCVAWGVTWQGYPEAMWGTENGTVLSWWVDTQKAATESGDKWNDRSVSAEFQSYHWVDNVNGKTFAHGSSEWKDTIGSATFKSENSTGSSYSLGSGSIPDNFKYFADKTSQETGLWGTIGFISTLETINDIEYSSDMWVAVGDQSDKDPADYCSSGSYNGGGEVAKAYSGNGRGGSWVNVRYWVDTNGSGEQSDTNAYYHWRAVKISNNENYNIVQINNVNGIWVATGYEDANNNEEYDDGERTVVCWARNPLGACDEYMDGKWSEKVQFYANNGASMTPLDQNKVGGINSCATRTE